MTSNRRLKPLRGSSAKLAIDACLQGMMAGKVTSLQVRNALRCEACPEMLQFERYLRSDDNIIKAAAAELVARIAPEKVIEVALEQEVVSGVAPFLYALESVECKNLENLTALLRRDAFITERVFQTFVKVGRADLLFGLAVSGDEKTTERVKRYLNEQGFI